MTMGWLGGGQGETDSPWRASGISAATLLSGRNSSAWEAHTNVALFPADHFSRELKHPRSQSTQDAEQSWLSSFLMPVWFLFPQAKKGLFYCNTLLQWPSRSSLLALGGNPRDCLSEGLTITMPCSSVQRGGLLWERGRFQYNLLEVNRPPPRYKRFFLFISLTSKTPPANDSNSSVETRTLLFCDLSFRKWSLSSTFSEQTTFHFWNKTIF